MRIHHRVLYLPPSADVPKADRTQNWWKAWNITIAVKDCTLKGYFSINDGKGNPLKIDKSNAIIVRRVFGAWVTQTARNECGDAFTLVPIPSKDAVVGSDETPRSAKLMQDALEFVKSPPPVANILKFTEKLKKASQGGPRFADEIYPKLTISGKVPKTPLVLVDDVMTSGGHMKASRQRLHEAGGKVACGIVCGRTVYSANLDPLAAGLIEIDDSLTQREFDVEKLMKQLVAGASKS